MSSHSKPLRILVADDHGLVRSGIRGLLLAHRGWKVEGEAADGSDAVAKANKLKPDLAIIDIAMPNLDGLEVTRQILEANPGIAVLILTMHESSQMVRRVLEAGARGYVLKSDLVGHLVKAVKAVSRGKMYLTPKVSSIVLEGFLKAGKESTDRNSQAKTTPREQEVIRLLAKGQGNKQIAATLGITVRTVETHRARIMNKLGMHSLTELVHYAIRNRLVSSEVL